MSLVLASASPRRRALLSAVGLHFEVRPADVDESVRPGEAAEDYVLRVARAKAEAARRSPEERVLAADTVVVLDGEVLGKPRDEAEAIRTLGALSGREHRVMTAVVLGGVGELRVTTRVRFRALSTTTIRWYIATGEPWDKAGGYGIQGHGAALVESVEGSYSNVVGLPLSETLALIGA